MTYVQIDNIARELVLDAMSKNERNVEDIDNPICGSLIDNFVKWFYKEEGNVSGSILTIILKDKYGVNCKI